MKITTKINLITTVWIVCLLIVINIIVYFLFMETTINMEKSIVFSKADQITKDLLSNQTPNNSEEILSNSLVDNSLIRIILPGDKVMAEATNDAKLAKKIKAVYVNEKDVKTRIIMTQTGEEEALVAYLPIQLGNQAAACLQISERLQGLEMRKEILRGILIFSTFFAAALSLSGGKLLSNLIMKPISGMIYTMDEIEKSGTMKKIDIQKDTKDDLHIMVTTFNKMIDRLQENMEKQKRFVSDASHEFKTPLTVIKSYANLLRRQGFQDETMAQDAIQAIYTEATRIQKMTETFLDLASMDTSLELKEIDIVVLCQSTTEQLKTVYQREISLHYDESPIIAAVDELRIKQVLIILLDNALKYSSDKINCFIEKNSLNIVIGIKDYGIGIPEEEIENIFERFYRVDKARSRETGGSGLGLHIAETIMKLHNGKIEISSKEGEGTLAKVILPV